jgi:peptide/nickel transport system ATP-binding protein
MTEPILSVRDLEKHYPVTKGILSRQVGAVRAVDGISFDIYPGETLGLVGESGCGKSTAASSIIRLEEPTGGEVIFNGGDRTTATRREDGTHPNDVTEFSKAELKAFRRGAQMIFQDPSSSFDPRQTVGSSISEMLLVHGMQDRHRRRAIVEDLLERVNMSAEDYDRYPHEFSGGQKQRIALARALVLNPDLVIADEPVSALDVSVQAEVLSLLDELQEEFGLSVLLISHDMGVVQEVCDRVAVMYLGEIVEIGETAEIFRDPQHPYTEALVSAVPTPNPYTQRTDIQLRGTVPNPANPPSGCRFHTRCHRVIQSSEYDLEQAQWRGVLNLRGEVESGALEIDKVRQSAAVSEDVEPSAVDNRAVREQIRTEFDLPAELPDREAEQVLSDALTALVSGDQSRAADLLSSEFVTPCEETKPEFTDHGDGHRSSCLRHRETYQSVEIASDD